MGLVVEKLLKAQATSVKILFVSCLILIKGLYIRVCVCVCDSPSSVSGILTDRHTDRQTLTGL